MSLNFWKMPQEYFAKEQIFELANQKLVDKDSFTGLFFLGDEVMGALISKPLITKNSKVIKISLICLKPDQSKI